MPYYYVPYFVCHFKYIKPEQQKISNRIYPDGLAAFQQVSLLLHTGLLNAILGDGILLLPVYSVASSAQSFGSSLCKDEAVVLSR